MRYLLGTAANGPDGRNFEANSDEEAERIADYTYSATVLDFVDWRPATATRDGKAEILVVVAG